MELEWATSNAESDTQGFLVKRRPTKTSEYTVVGSYKDWGPLQTKGPDGGVYRFLDTTTSPGSWVYRISEVDLDGKENDVSCQCLVHVQTEEEQRGAVIAAFGISVVAIVSPRQQALMASSSFRLRSIIFYFFSSTKPQ